MAPKKKLTEYERRRLDNIKRNNDMLASLRIHSRAFELSSISNPKRPHPKSYQVIPEKKQKSAEPVALRRSSRTKGVPPDILTAGGLKEDVNETPKDISPKPESQSSTHCLCREPEPFTMRDAFRGEGSDLKLIDMIKSFTRKYEMSASDGVDNSTEGDMKREQAGDFKSDAATLNTTDKKEGVGDCDVKSRVNGLVGLDGQELKTDNVGLEGVVRKAKVGSVDFDRRVSGTINFGGWDLKPENAVRVVPGRITSVKFLPTTDQTLVAVGNNLGNVGFWNVDVEGEGTDTYLYHPHSATISAIVIEPFSMSKMFTCSNDGFIRLMDIQRELFDFVRMGDFGVYSMSGRPQDSNSLYFSEGAGEFDIWDLRAGKSPATWNLHNSRINTIEFNSEDTNLLATSSSDRTACIWDLRKICADNPVPLKVIRHERAVQSAFFSPSGRYLATTSLDDKVGVSSGTNYEDMSMIDHDSQSGRGIWGWDDSYIYIGSTNRGIDVISVVDKKVVASLESEKMTAIPCRLDAHRRRVGMLAGGTSGGQIYVWTSS